MAQICKPLIHFNSDSLHIRLRGGFDANAALQLIQLISKYQRNFKRIFVHTGFLDTIDADVAETFKSSFSFPEDNMDEIVFTGENAEHIAPYAWQVL